MTNPFEFLYDQTDLISNNDARALCHDILDWDRFQEAFGSDTKHHAYKGALLHHTAEVMDIAMATATAVNSIKVDLDVLRTAVVYHDVMKTRDYTSEGKPTDYKFKIYHVSGSYAQWMIDSDGMNEYFRDAVGHCILSHHGRREWKACVEPQTVEAHILHHADLLSATYGRTMLWPER